MDYTVAVERRTGLLQSLRAGIVANGGGRANISVLLTMVGATSLESVYYFPKTDVAATAIASRAVDCGSARGFGALETITPTGLAARGWTAAGLHAFLGRGIARQGSAFGDMHPVIMLSTRNMTAEDLDAVVTYLLGDDPLPAAPLPAVDPAQIGVAAIDTGRLSYVALCAGCHGLDGNGVPHTVVPLRNNSTLRLADPRNLIVAMLDGIGWENFPHRGSMQAMPGFSDKLGDDAAAALANYLRVTFGGQKGDVTAADVRALR
jgi:mono/diheme cytochrome c family protein